MRRRASRGHGIVGRALAVWSALALALGVARAEESAPAAAASAPAESPAQVLVSIKSTREGTVVERRANHVKGWSLTLPFPAYTSTEQWEPVCVAPCAMRLDQNAIYKIDGVGVAPSSAFVLPRSPELLELRVHAGSKLWHDVGRGTTVLGVVTLIVGAAVAAGASTAADAGRTLLYVCTPGLALTAIGGVLWGVNGSSVRTSSGRSL